MLFRSRRVNSLPFRAASNSVPFLCMIRGSEYAPSRHIVGSATTQQICRPEYQGGSSMYSGSITPAMPVYVNTQNSCYATSLERRCRCWLQLCRPLSTLWKVVVARATRGYDQVSSGWSARRSKTIYRSTTPILTFSLRLHRNRRLDPVCLLCSTHGFTTVVQPPNVTIRYTSSKTHC